MGKKISLVILAIVLAVALTSGGVFAASKKPIKIGYINSFTGMFSVLAVPGKKGITAYIDWLNKQGGIAGHPVKLYLYDNESDPVKGRLALKKAVNVDKVHLISGSSATGTALAMASAAAENKIAFLSNSGSGIFEMLNKKAGPEQHKWNFRPDGGIDAEYYLSTAYFYKKRGISKIAFLTPTTGFGKARRRLGLQIYPKLGIDVVLSDTYPGNATTFGALISKVKAHPEIQAVACYGAELASALATVAFREAGFGEKPLLLIAQTIGTREHLKLMKIRRAYEGLYGDVTNVEPWDTLPEKNACKPLLTQWAKIWADAYGGERLSGMFDVAAMEVQVVINTAWERLLKDKPDVLDKDLATIRSAFRDYLETNPTVCNGGFILSVTPADHAGHHLGTNEVIAKFEKGKWVYHSQGMTDPGFVNYVRETAPKIGWKGPVVELHK